MQSDMPEGEIIVPADKLRVRIGELAREIAPRTENMVFVGLLEGGRRFCEALLDKLHQPPPVIWIKARSYGGRTQSSGSVQIENFDASRVAGKDVLLIDDIYDTGRTLHAVSERLRACGARSVTVCVMILKRTRRAYAIPIHYAGFEAEDRFLIGFGLDYRGACRDLDDIIAVDHSAPRG
jgi:hypoxanthine phosphoribosyltransferase